MGKERASGLTPRQQEWLGHLRQAVRAGESVRAYARRQRLSEHALYQAAKGLRRKGVRVPSAQGSKKGAAARPAVAEACFAEVKAAPAPALEATGSWRARLPNGVVIEGSGELGRVLEALGRL
jgi:hypothetical protein